MHVPSAGTFSMASVAVPVISCPCGTELAHPAATSIRPNANDLLDPFLMALLLEWALVSRRRPGPERATREHGVAPPRRGALDPATPSEALAGQCEQFAVSTFDVSSTPTSASSYIL
jgi:hypothetical protein